MDVKKISDFKNAAAEILSDEQLDNVAGGTGSGAVIGTGHGFWIPMKNESKKEFPQFLPRKRRESPLNVGMKRRKNNLHYLSL